MSRKPFPRINPDGVEIKFNWKKLRVGESVFVPCINVVSARFQIMAIAKKLGFKMKFYSRIERGMYGLRAWRVG